MDFQSRVNSFRQGLQQQQNQFDTASANMAQFGRRYLPDKVAQHYAYLEKVGGLITGTSAGLQGAQGLAKRVAKQRALRQSKITPSARPSEVSQADRAQAQAQQAGTQKEASTQRATQPEQQKAPENPFEGPSDEASDAIGRAGGGKLGKGNREGVFDEPEEEPAPSAPAPNRAINRFQGEPEQKSVGGTPDDYPKPITEADRTATKGGDLISPETLEALKPIEIERPAPNRVPGTAEGDVGAGTEKDLTQGAKAFEGVKPTPQGTGEAVASASQDVAEAGETAMNVGKAIAKTAVETVADVGMDAVPFIGEVAGLGMLIRNIVKDHKHEENAPPPQLTAPTPEAQEQSGGFDASMLKQSLSAGIV
tara:strand:- start:4580 stop:5677 length:1098 start_codon:yes stop_codon:yes gene_type:complete